LYSSFEREGVEILADEVTMDMMSGSTIDYKTEMIKSAFEV
jgi:Fe-S cluster assembly iron-binding protein IscA